MSTAGAPLPNSKSASPSPGPTVRHAQSALDKQRVQLEKLLKDPAKPAYVPPPPKDKSLRPAREMMKNVQGSSAGAGSGEFHVYKASRRREYERLKMLDEKSQKETVEAEFERKKREWEEQANAKTSKNRAKRQKKKEKARIATKETSHGEKEKEKAQSAEGGRATESTSDAPVKKRRLVSGKELVFKRPGEEESDEDGHGEEEDQGRGVDGEDVGPPISVPVSDSCDTTGIIEQARAVTDTHRIIIHEDD